MANGTNRFINVNDAVVSRGLRRLLDQGIGQEVQGVPSFTDTDMRKFLTAKNIDTPQTIPNQPLEDPVSPINIDPAVGTFSPDLTGLINVQERQAELKVRMNEVGARNIELIESDPTVSAARQALTRAQTMRTTAFEPGQIALFDQQIEEATNALITARERARKVAAEKTAAQTVDLQNELIILEQREKSIEKLRTEEEKAKSGISPKMEQVVTAMERLTDTSGTVIRDTFNNFTDQKKLLVGEFASLPDNQFWHWADPRTQQIDRDGVISAIEAKLSVKDGERFRSQISHFDKLMRDAETEAERQFDLENKRLIRSQAPPITNAAATASWINTKTQELMNEGTGQAFDAFVRGAPAESIDREGFTNDEFWQTARLIQENIDPTVSNLQAAVSDSLGRLGPMDPNTRRQAVTEYMRKFQSMFNEPRNAFGMGMNQVNIDTLSDDINTRAVMADQIRQKQEQMRIQFEEMGMSLAGVDRTFIRSGDPFGLGFRGGVPRGSPRAVGSPNLMSDTLAPTGQTTIIENNQSAVDIALNAAETADVQARNQAQVNLNARIIRENNPGLTDEEVAQMAEGSTGQVTTFLSALNAQEIGLLVEMMRSQASLSTDPAERNMFDQLLNKVAMFTEDKKVAVG